MSEAVMRWEVKEPGVLQLFSCFQFVSPTLSCFLRADASFQSIGLTMEWVAPKELPLYDVVVVASAQLDVTRLVDHFVWNNTFRRG